MSSSRASNGLCTCSVRCRWSSLLFFKLPLALQWFTLLTQSVEQVDMSQVAIVIGETLDRGICAFSNRCYYSMLLLPIPKTRPESLVAGGFSGVAGQM